MYATQSPEPAAPTAGESLERCEKAFELMRCDAVLEELQACRSNNKPLIAWFTGRRAVLRQELCIPAPVRRS